jgi:hypothetical protein
MFENMLSAKPDMMLTPVEDLVSRSNMGWFRLLYMVLTLVPSLESVVCEKIHDDTMLLCTRLLVSPAMIIYDKIIETILIKLSRYNRSRSLDITKSLLRAENGFNSGLYSTPHGILMETLVNILYQISESDNEETQVTRTDFILKWLNECSTAQLSIDTTSSTFHKQPSNMILHCVACILYKVNKINDISTEFFVSLVKYSINTSEYYTKQSIDWILCAVLHQKPTLVHELTKLIDMKQMASLVNQTTSNRSIESKASLSSMTNEQKTILSLIETLSYAVQVCN